MEYPLSATPQYLPTLLAELRRLSSIPFDYAVFSCILLCLVAGDKHLLLRTKEEDIHAVQKQAANILISLFGFPTHRLKVRPEHTVDDVLRGLFITPPSTISSYSHLPPTRPPRARSGTIRPHSNLSHTSSHITTGGGTAQQYSKPHRDSVSGSPTTTRLSIADTYSDTASLRALRPRSGRGFPSVAEDPDRLLTSSLAPIDVAPKLPHALVVSGLEWASTSVQMALWNVLRTRRVVLEDQDDAVGGVWNLPDKFIMVCVGPLGDGRERPRILKCLIDRFAYTSSIVLDRNIPYSSDVCQTSHITQDHLEQLQRFSNNVHVAPFLTLRMSALMTATRHHPQLDGSLLTSRCTNDVADFVRAAHTVFGGTKEPTMAEWDRGDATAFNVDSIFRNIVGHRVRVRNSPGDEVMGSLVTTAIKGRNLGHDFRRRTTGDILREIMNQV